jgi:hypothetical protein
MTPTNFPEQAAKEPYLIPVPHIETDKAGYISIAR